jgi:plastocyanin
MSIGRNVRLRSAVAIVAVSAASVTTVVAAPAASAKSRTSVAIPGFFFSPSTITVHPGTRVTWTNTHLNSSGVAVPHDVTTDAGSRVGFASPTLTAPSAAGPGNPSFTVKLTKKGTYAYHCSIHPGMKGTVVVR